MAALQASRNPSQGAPFAHPAQYQARSASVSIRPSLVVPQTYPSLRREAAATTTTTSSSPPLQHILPLRPVAVNIATTPTAKRETAASVAEEATAAAAPPPLPTTTTTTTTSTSPDHVVPAVQSVNANPNPAWRLPECFRTSPAVSRCGVVSGAVKVKDSQAQELAELKGTLRKVLQDMASMQSELATVHSANHALQRRVAVLEGSAARQMSPELPKELSLSPSRRLDCSDNTLTCSQQRER